MTDAIPDEIMREATLVAVDMEIHAALSTTTRAKAEVIARALMARKRDAQMTDALLTAEARVRELEQKLERARVALDPFAKEFDERREAYIRRYPRHPAVGAANFDKMPDGWEMEKLVFPMGVFRRARAALAEIGQRG